MNRTLPDHLYAHSKPSRQVFFGDMADTKAGFKFQDQTLPTSRKGARAVRCKVYLSNVPYKNHPKDHPAQPQEQRDVQPCAAATQQSDLVANLQDRQRRLEMTREPLGNLRIYWKNNELVRFAVYWMLLITAWSILMWDVIRTTEAAPYQ